MSIFRWTRALSVVGCTFGLAAGSAAAADASEYWPEFSLFYGLSPTTRLYLDVAQAGGQESNGFSYDLSAFYDLSLKPILREELLTADWQRSRYLWTRLGYTHVSKVSDGVRTSAEDRVVLAIHSKAALPAEVWLEARARLDLRWIGGDYSTRYRFRLEATREFDVNGHAVVPYAHAEAFYDTRYEGWARSYYQAGVEVTLTPHFRTEVYLGYQTDRLPAPQDLDVLGVVAKWYY